MCCIRKSYLKSDKSPKVMSLEAEDYRLNVPVRRIEGDVLTEMEFNIPDFSFVFCCVRMNLYINRVTVCHVHW